MFSLLAFKQTECAKYVLGRIRKNQLDAFLSYNNDARSHGPKKCTG